MTRLLLTLILMTTMNGCATSNTSDYESQLQWLQQANPQQDAQAALAQGDFRLMAFAQRSLVIPGVDVENSRKYELKCGVKIMEGMTDVIRSEEHLRLMKLAHTYALQYNAVIKTRCQP